MEWLSNCAMKAALTSNELKPVPKCIVIKILIALCYDNALYRGPDAWPSQHEHQQL